MNHNASQLAHMLTSVNPIYARIVIPLVEPAVEANPHNVSVATPVDTYIKPSVLQVAHLTTSVEPLITLARSAIQLAYSARTQALQIACLVIQDVSWMVQCASSTAQLVSLETLQLIPV